MPYRDRDAGRRQAREAARRRRDRAFDVKQGEALAQLETRPRLPDADLAWAAGMFEGEGTATIVTSMNHCGNRTNRCRISLTSTDPEIIEFFVARWPPSKIGTKRNKPHHKPALVWILDGPRVLPFIADIGPFLRTTAERQKFALVEQAQWLRSKGSRDPERLRVLVELTEQIRSLNRRGQDPASAA